MSGPRASAARRVLLLALVASLAAGPSLQAATQRELSLGEMVDLSDEIVVGRVIDNEVRWQDEVIITVTRVAVEESLHGAPPARVEVTQLGGTAIHPRTGIAMTMTASTHVELRPGDEVLLFVGRRPGLRQIVGAQQGHYPIRLDAASGRRVLPVGPKRLEASRAPGAVALSAREIGLDEMRRRIGSELERRAARPAGDGR